MRPLGLEGEPQSAPFPTCAWLEFVFSRSQEAESTYKGNSLALWDILGQKFLDLLFSFY